MLVRRTVRDLRRHDLGGPLRLICSAATPRGLLRWARTHDDAVTVQFDGSSLDRVHVELAAHPQGACVVDLSLAPRPISRLFLAIAHCRHDGTVVQLLPRTGPDRERILAFAARAAELIGQDALKPPTSMDRRPEPVRDVHALAASVHTLEVRGRLLVARVAVSPLRTVSEPMADELLARAPGLGEVLFVDPEAEWRRPASFASTRPDEARCTDRLAPPLHARLYRDAVCRPRMVATVGDLVLNETFRHPSKARPRTPVLHRWHDWYAVDRQPVREPERCLEGVFLHADSFLRGHFGHGVTEQLSHLWAWQRVADRLPGVRLLMSEFADHPVRDWEWELLTAAGVPRERVEVISDPVRVERLVTTTPAYEISEYIHPALTPLVDGVGTALESAADEQRVADLAGPKVFFTRRHELRACRNKEEVEALAASNGFTVIAPEEHPLAVQVAIARRARVLAGFGGSGLFHSLFAPGGKRLLVVTSTNYPAANEKQMSAFRGNDLQVFRGTPEVPSRGDGVFVNAAFHSPYRIDWHREGKALERALAAD